MMWILTLKLMHLVRNLNSVSTKPKDVFETIPRTIWLRESNARLS